MLYVNSSVRSAIVSEGFEFTSFSIGGCSGDGGVTGTTLESFVTAGLLGKPTV